ncbi:MAG: LytTR family DNA-binding domain-containing protein [Bacteroidota bacterium]
MTINCIIIDDEPLAIDILVQYIGNIDDLNLKGTFENPMGAQELLKIGVVDLIFLDIQMPLITGIDFIKSTKLKAGIIFTTAHRNYAIESYELDVVDYLLKPISFSRFLKSVNKYKEAHTPVHNKTESAISNDFIYVNVNKKHVKVTFNEILYVDSLKDYIKIHTSETQIVTKEKIGSFLEKLPENFIRVHRSYIVNKNHVTAITAKDVEIDKIEIPIGSNFKHEIKRLKQDC